MDIMTGLSALSETLKITKELREIDDKVAVADLKLKLADLVDSVLDAKQALQEAKQREAELCARILELETQIEENAHLQDEDGCLFKIDETGTRIGEPYCNRCYVSSGKMFRLRKNTSNYSFEYRCDECSTGAGKNRGMPTRTQRKRGHFS